MPLAFASMADRRNFLQDERESALQSLRLDWRDEWSDCAKELGRMV